MVNYILRRLLYAVPILIGINVLTFALFFMVNSADDMARMQLGQKHVKLQVIKEWKRLRGYDLPLFYNDKATGLHTVTNTLFFQKSCRLFVYDFGVSDAGRDIGGDILQRIWPSLSIALPVLFLSLGAELILAMLLTLFRGSCLDLSGVVLCIILMSISTLFYIISGQYIFAIVLKWVPISGYDSGFNSMKFIILPIAVAVISGLGGGGRWYRTLLLEEMHKGYVQTARAKGLSDWQVLYKHVIKNAMLPILTGIVVVIPSLFMGSLVLESFFGVPGLGSYVIDAIQQQDFAIVRAMVFLGSVLYLLGLLLTDFAYVMVDPRVRLK